MEIIETLIARVFGSRRRLPNVHAVSCTYKMSSSYNPGPFLLTVEPAP
jgi:hypothetical protein